MTRGLAAVFFRKLTVVGRHRIPPVGPLVVVANHVNGLVDLLLIWAAMPRPPCTLGKSTLWDIKALAWLLDLAGVIPVYRRIDQGVDTSKNQGTFERTHRALANGEVVALFPEGIAHDFPELQPLRTGAARIALAAEAEYGPLGVKVVPIGILFDDKYSFRSNALVVVGDPMDLAPAGVPLDDSPETVRTLTDRIATAIHGLTLNYESWDAARLFERTAEVVAADDRVFCALVRLAELGSGNNGAAGSARAEPSRAAGGADLRTSFEVRKALNRVYPLLLDRFPEQVANVSAAAGDWDLVLERTGLAYDLVVPGLRPLGLVREAARAVAETVALPIAFLGWILNLLPYQVPGLIARRSGDRHLAATYKLYVSIVAYPLAWTLEGGLLAWWLGRFWLAPLVWIVAPASGLVALRLWESGVGLLRRVRAFVRLRAGRDRGEVRAAHRRLEQSILDLLARAQVTWPESAVDFAEHGADAP